MTTLLSVVAAAGFTVKEKGDPTLDESEDESV